MFGLSHLLAKPPEAIAAVDLGSNSFHMKVARLVDGELHVIDRLREMVRLGAGLRDDKRLCILLRLAVVLHRDRQAVTQLPSARLEPGESSLAVMFSDGWLSENPLTRADLEREARYLRDAGFELSLA